MPKIVGIIQARVGSTRLPNKVVKKLCDKTILEILLSRLRKSRLMDTIVVATTTKKDDDIIETIAVENSFEIFRGSENDVLDRYFNAARRYNGEVIVRITADNPLNEADLIDSLIEFFVGKNLDYASLKEPLLGVGCEVITIEALTIAWKKGKKRYQREHVTPYIYEHPERFQIAYMDPPNFLKRHDIRLTIDTPEDFELFQELCKHFGDLVNTDISDVITFLDQNPNIKLINQDVRQKRYNEAKL